MTLTNTYSINVDIKRRMTSIVPTFSQGDSAVLKFRVYDNGKLMDMSDYTHSEVMFRQPSGRILTGDAELVNGEVVYTFTGLEMSEIGKLETILSVSSGSSTVSIQPFYCFIFDSMRSNNLEYIGILQELIKEVQGLELDVGSLLSDFNSFDYSPTTTYDFPNLVTYNGSTYIALKQVRGITPIDDKINYRLAAQRGDVAIFEELSNEIRQKSQAANLAYKESYATLTALQNAYPTGNQNNHVVLSDGMIYTWSNNAWVNTQIQANGTGIVKHSVTPSHTNFFTEYKGRNLLNPANIEFGTWLGNTLANTTATKTAFANADWNSFKVVEIEPDKDYVFLVNGAFFSPPNSLYSYWYDSNGNAISTFSFSTVVRSPVNAKYVRASFKGTNTATYGLYQASGLVDYEEYTEPHYVLDANYLPTIEDNSVTPSHTSFLTVGKNLFDKSKVRLGYTLHQASGVAVPNYPIEFVSDFIEITANEQYTFRGTTRIVYYDSSKRYIAVDGMTSPTTFTSRANTAYIRVCGHITSLNTVQIEKGNVFTGYEEYVHVLHEKLRLQESNLPDKVISRQNLDDTLGDRLDSINLDDYSKLTFTPINSIYVVYNSNATGMFSWDSVDSRKLTINNTGSGNAIVQVGSAAYYGAVGKHMYHVSDYTVLSKSENVTMREAKAFNVRIPSIIGDNVNILKTTGSWQNIVELTVPTGSSVVIRFNHMGFIFEDDEKDEFSDSSMKNIYETTNLKSDGVYFNYKPLTAKQADTALIANEAYSIASKWKSKVWVSYGDSITAGNGWQPFLVNRFGLIHTNKGIGGSTASGNGANAGWLDERINSFPANVDLITIMFGTNDWSQNKPIGTDDGNTDTYKGALGVIVRKLITKYPLARIIVMAPPFRTESQWSVDPPVIPFDTGTAKDMKLYAEAAEYIAWKYGCKFVNMWADMGINQINFKSFLANEQWPVHLNPNGNKRFAEVMIGKLAEIEPLE